MKRFNKSFEGHIRFGEGFVAAVESYESLSWWERLIKKPIGRTHLNYITQRCVVDYGSE